MRKRTERQIAITLYAASALLALQSCAGSRSFLGVDTPPPENTKPIRNPFGGYDPAAPESPRDSMIFRSRRGDGSVEVEIPRGTQGVTDFVLPVSPQFKNASRSPASGAIPMGNAAEPSATGDAGTDTTYMKRPQSQIDREITRTFPQALPEDRAKQNEIEQGLGLVPNDEPTPERERSYLASIDHIKQLYRLARYEAALIEIDGILRDFPTDPRLHQMKGTLLDRLGQPEMALRSWNQALRLDPSNLTLRKFVERREQKLLGGKDR